MPRLRRRRLATAWVALACIVATGCALRRARVQDDFGIPNCRDGAERDLLSSEALQCWFSAPHGRWRMLNHQSHLEALVVDVEARDRRDAVAIAQRVVDDSMTDGFSEILIYVAQPIGRELHIRRVRWIRGHPFETLDFTSPAGDAPLTIRSSPGSATEAHPNR
jgi:hypothetical protein